MKTAIIGGGVGGLISALYLSKLGADVTIFEKSNKLGGRLTFVEYDDFKIDEGPTIILLPQIIMEILAETGVDASPLEMIQIDPMYPLHFPDGTTFLKWSDRRRQKEEIEHHFPGEEESFETYVADMRDRFEKGEKAFLQKDFSKKRSFWTKENMKTLLKLKAYQTVKAQTGVYFKSKQLREAFAFQTLYIGGSPKQTPALYSLIPFSEHEHGIWYLKGGYARLVSLLTEEVEKRGITTQYESEVTNVTVKENRVESITVREKQYSFDKFIFNGDFPLIEKMVMKKSTRSYTPSSGTLLLYLGFDGHLPTEHMHQFFMGNDLDSLMDDIFDKQVLPEDPSIYLFTPSKYDASLAPSGKSVAYILVPVPSNTSISRDDYDKFAEKILDVLSERLNDNLLEKLLWKKMRTPHEAKADGLFGGGSFGIAPTLFQSGVFRPQVKPFPYENAYAVGASIHPGGGIPIVMQGARLLAKVLEEENSFARRGTDYESKRSV
ncbi:phytoene desaturase family protein [Evansella sp. AB-rgal1]|uniref:phytoene desaturase family protein n=1 Tax=Evansella sp. AB-rgal1 TaxID=3242696 RepID=UPI00359D10C4